MTNNTEAGPQTTTTLGFLRNQPFYNDLPERAKDQIDEMVAENPEFAAALIVALEWSVDEEFDEISAEAKAGDIEADENRKKILNEIYTIFQIMLKPEDYKKAAEVIFKSPFWIKSLHGEKNQDQIKTIIHIIDANNIFAEFVKANDLKASEVFDLGVGGGNTIKALSNSLPNANFEGAELSKAQISEVRKREDLKGVDLKISESSLDTFLEGKLSKGETVQVISSGYALHHLYHPKLLNEALEKNKVELKDGFVYFDGKQIMSEDDFDRSKLKKTDLSKSPQVEALKKCFQLLNEDGHLMLADPGSGLSIGFNTFMAEQGVKIAKGEETPVGIEGLKEVGPACFSSLEEMADLLQEIGFIVEKKVLQYSDEEGEYQKLHDGEIDSHEKDNQNDYHLGWVLIARKPGVKEDVRNQLIEV
jgi:hypothetical protein